MSGRFVFDARATMAAIEARHAEVATAVPAVLAAKRADQPQQPQPQSLSPALGRPKAQTSGTHWAASAALLEREPLDADAIEERAALAADCVPACYLDAWASLNHRKPIAVSEAEWRRAVDNAGVFLDEWGSVAVNCGWKADDVFEFHPRALCARDDCKGLAWLLTNGARVTAINADGADIIMVSGSRQRFYRQPENNK